MKTFDSILNTLPNWQLTYFAVCLFRIVGMESLSLDRPRAPNNCSWQLYHLNVHHATYTGAERRTAKFRSAATSGPLARWGRLLGSCAADACLLLVADSCAAITVGLLVNGLVGDAAAEFIGALTCEYTYLHESPWRQRPCADQFRQTVLVSMNDPVRCSGVEGCARLADGD